MLLQLSKTEEFVLILDEFQEFYNINESVYSEIQSIWDTNKHDSKIQVIFIGSVYSLMIKIFQNSREPLFGRADRLINLKPFKASTIKEILVDNKSYSAENLFYSYVITGGVPRYQEILVSNKAFTRNSILNLILEKNSPFINEGKHVLIEEFGKEYATYFSVLELISVGKTSRSEIESILGKNIGGYLERLEKEYGVIKRVKPINAKPLGRLQKYKIIDNFLNFWFCFIYRYRSAIEAENFEYLKRIIERDFSRYCGSLLEKLFHQLLVSSGNYNKIGNYWERGNLNEIDIVAENTLDKKLLIADVKLNPEKLRLELLKQKSERLIADRYADFEISYSGFSIKDIDSFV